MSIPTTQHDHDGHALGRLGRRAVAATALALGATALSPTVARSDPGTKNQKGDLRVEKDLYVAGELVVQGEDTWIDVRAYGAVGDGATDDTAAIRAAAAAVPVSGGTLLFPRGTFSVAGEISVSDRADLTVVGLGARLVQRTEFTKTLAFARVDGLHVRDLEFEGVGTEHVGTRTSFNGVAGVFLDDVSDVVVEGCSFRNHAGGGLRWTGDLVGARFHANRFVGVGAPIISTLDNNSDFAIGGFAATRNERITVSGNDIAASCFGIGVSGGNDVTIVDNHIHDLPGQHGVYLSASSRVVVSGNQVHRTAGLGVKNQVAETYAGDVTDNLIAGNVFTECQTAIVVATTSGVAASRHLTNVQISDNVIRGCRESGIYHTAGIDSRIIDNSIDSVGNYGIYLSYVSGEISGNTIRRTGWDGIYANIDDLTVFRNNLFLDAAMNTTGGAVGDVKWSHHIFVSKSSAARTAQPLAMFRSNVHHQPSVEPTSLVRVVRTGSSVAVMWNDVVNTTSASLQTGSAGELIYSDVLFAPESTVTTESAGSAVVAGRGHREFHAVASPQSLPATGKYGVGDVCWHASPAATGEVGWVCIGAGSPGVWRAFG